MNEFYVIEFRFSRGLEVVGMTGREWAWWECRECARLAQRARRARKRATV